MRALAWVALVGTLAIVLSPLVGAGLSLGPLPAIARVSVEGSLVIASVAAATAMLLGTAYGLLVLGTNVPGRRTLAWVALLAFAMPPYLAAAAWIDAFGPAGRVVAFVARLLGLAAATPDEARLGVYRFAGFVYTAPSSGIVLGACYFPIVALAIAAADRALDRRTLEAARLARGRLGAFRIAGASLAPVVVGAGLIVFALAFTEFSLPQVLRVRTLGEDVYSALQAETPSAASLGLALGAIAAVFGGAGTIVLSRARIAPLGALEGDAPSFEPRPRTLARVLAALVTTVVALAPTLLLPVSSFVIQAAAGEGLATALGRAWATTRGEPDRTVVLALVGASLAVVSGGAAGRILSRVRGGALVSGLLAIGVAVPGPVVQLGLVKLWNHHATAWVYDGFAVVLLACLVRALPIVVLLARDGFARVPRELEEAAALAGKTGGARLRGVVLPLAGPSLVAAWALAYVLIATEFAAIVPFLVPPGREVLAPTVVNLVHYGQDATIAASSLLLLAVTGAPLALLGIALSIRRRLA